MHLTWNGIWLRCWALLRFPHASCTGSFCARGTGSGARMAWARNVVTDAKQFFTWTYFPSCVCFFWRQANHFFLLICKLIVLLFSFFLLVCATEIMDRDWWRKHHLQINFVRRVLYAKTASLGARPQSAETGLQGFGPGLSQTLGPRSQLDGCCLIRQEQAAFILHEELHYSDFIFFFLSFYQIT